MADIQQSLINRDCLELVCEGEKDSIELER